MPATRNTNQPRIVTPDNGYFQVWELPCGCRLRHITEFTGYARRNPARRRQLDAQTKAQLANHVHVAS